MTTFDSTKASLSQLLGEIKEGKVQLPDFQRGWVWDDDLDHRELTYNNSGRELESMNEVSEVTQENNCVSGEKSPPCPSCCDQKQAANLAPPAAGHRPVVEGALATRFPPNAKGARPCAL